MKIRNLTFAFALVLLILTNCLPVSAEGTVEQERIISSTLDDPGKYEYNGSPFAVVNDNVPDFYLWQITSEPYVRFSHLDELGRTGPGMACLGKETLPAEKRGQIGNIKPSGWHTVRYDDLIEDKYLYNRSHVIGYQLCGDNNTPENLFTGTRYFNADTMLFFENKVRQYLDLSDNNHVIYRVTPMYKDKDLVASGVQMEAFSVEDLGKSLCFNVFVYNVQPGLEIDYRTGKSQRISGYTPGKETDVAEAYASLIGNSSYSLTQSGGKNTNGSEPANDNGSQTGAGAIVHDKDTVTGTEEPGQDVEGLAYVLNTNTKKFHYPSCQSVSEIKEKNKKDYSGSRGELIKQGYSPCGRCNP